MKTSMDALRRALTPSPEQFSVIAAAWRDMANLAGEDPVARHFNAPLIRQAQLSVAVLMVRLRPLLPELAVTAATPGELAVKDTDWALAVTLLALGGEDVDDVLLGQAIYLLDRADGPLAQTVVNLAAGAAMAAGLSGERREEFGAVLAAAGAGSGEHAARARRALDLATASAEELAALGEDLPALLATLTPAQKGHLMVAAGQDRQRLLIRAMSVLSGKATAMASA